MPESRHRRRRGRAASRGRRPSATPRAGAAPTRRRRKTNYLYLAASAIIAVLVIAGFALGDIANFGASTSNTGRSQDYVEGVGVRQDLMPSANHVADGQPVNYSTIPPTSGDHWLIPASCGFYEEGLPDEQIVHNLEHGNIVVSYNLETVEEVNQLRDVLDNIGLARVWGVTRFYNKEGFEPGTVAVAAWGVLDTMQGVDAERIKRFFETYAGNLGPEQIVC